MINETQAPLLEDVEIFGFKEENLDYTENSKLEQSAAGFHAEIKAPYYEDGQLTTTISWLDHPLCSPEKRSFNVIVKEARCKDPYMEREIEVNQCVVDIHKLAFECEYVVLVEDVLTKQVRSGYVRGMIFGYPPNFMLSLK